MEQEGGEVRPEVMCGGGLAQRNPGQEEAREKPFPLLTRHGVGSVLGTGYQRGAIWGPGCGESSFIWWTEQEGTMKARRVWKTSPRRGCLFLLASGFPSARCARPPFPAAELMPVSHPFGWFTNLPS